MAKPTGGAVAFTANVIMKFSIFYVASVVILNLAFEYIPPVVLSDGTIWSVGSVLAGAIFITRDYAQREVGHKAVLGLMIVSGVISYFMASPFVAIASVSAFAVSELCDYLVYTFKKGSFKQKVVLSSLVSVPVDTFVFLSIINHISWFSFCVMVLSKLVVLSVIAARK